MSLFVTFEGGEGSGKTTQVEMLADRLDEEGVDFLAVREPGTTVFGHLVRDCLKRGVLTDEAELCLFVAARAELVARELRPALDRPDAVVIADRYADSTYAYQGRGRGLPIDLIERLNGVATKGVSPDVTFLLDCAPEVGLARVGSIQLNLPLEVGSASGQIRREDEGAGFEQEGILFHRRVREGYRELAREEPDRWVVIDAARPPEEIGEIVWSKVRPLLPPEATTR